MSDSVQRQAGASFFVPEANLGMIQAGIAAFEEARRTGAASKDNGDANVVYAVYEAMREKPDQIL
jgi:hypothetical protein